MIAIDRGANAQFSTADVDRATGGMPPRQRCSPSSRSRSPPLCAACSAAVRRAAPPILNPAPAQDLSAHDLSSVSVITPNETEAPAWLGLGAGERADEEVLAAACWNVAFLSLHAATGIVGPHRPGARTLVRLRSLAGLVGGRLGLVDSDHLSFALKTPCNRPRPNQPRSCT